MRTRNKILLQVLNLMILGMLWFPLGLVANAEEKETNVPGFHKYIETEEESIDHWYGVARGTYLKEGICTVKDADTAKISVSGTTFAHSVCDKVRVSVYLDESSDGGNTFSQIGSYYFSEENTATCYGSKTRIAATSGWYYMARGGHSVTKGSTTETTTTKTRALKCS